MKWTIATAATLTLAFAFGMGVADAHSKKEATQPVDGSVLVASPEIISMTFDMPLRVTLISLTDQDGNEHVMTRSDNLEPVSEFRGEPPALLAGQYKLQWRGLSGDGHPMQGGFGFEIAN